MKGSNQVKALVVDDAYDNVGKLKRQHFVTLPELRYFEAQQVEFIGDFINILPNIRWLCLPLHKNEGLHPINFPMENLIILNLNCSSNLQDDWGGWSQIKMAKKLKVMDLSDCPSLTKLPDFPESGSLEWLDVSNVNGLDSGVELDVGNLWNLKLLHLSNIKIGRITGGTIGTMKRLEDLDLNDLECDNLMEVLVDIGELTCLERLQITRSEKAIMDYQLSKEEEEEETTSSSYDDDEEEEDKQIIAAQMEASSNQEAEGGVVLGKLPTSLKLLYTSYKVVNLWELLELEDLFVLDSNSELKIPPADEDSWWKVSKLKSMMLKKTKIEVVPTTSTSQSSSSSSSSSCMLPSSLTSLLVWDCLESVWLPTLENLENLVHVAIKECSYLGEIQGLENLLQFNKLETLELTSCPLLTSTFLRGSAGTAAGKIVIESLRELCIRKCGGGIPHLPSFPRLTTLEIGPLTPPDNDDQGMESQLEGIARLEELERLRLSELVFVERLPSFSKLQKLAFLVISNMPRLREIQGLAELKSLERLILAGCTSLERLILPAAAAGDHHLKELDIRGCNNLPPGDLSALKANLPDVRIRWPHEPCRSRREIPSVFRGPELWRMVPED
ncbi:unnamed protein product [Linum trigynum]